MNKSHFNFKRRQFLSVGALALASQVLMPSRVFASLSTSKPQILTINNINTLESLSVHVAPSQAVDKDQLSKLSYLFRDHRSDQTKSIDAKLFDQLLRLQILLKVQKPIALISGYRAPVSNSAMRKKKSGVAKNSYHTKGQAMDFRIEGVPLKEIKEAMISLNAGGVGYYPNSNFVHIDTGPVRTW